MLADSQSRFALLVQYIPGFAIHARCNRCDGLTRSIIFPAAEGSSRSVLCQWTARSALPACFCDATACTSNPASSAARTQCRPMKPVAPVMSTDLPRPGKCFFADLDTCAEPSMLGTNPLTA